MDNSEWEHAAIELFTEVSVLGALVSERINKAQPLGLNETRLSILMILAKQDGLGMTRDSIIWMMEEGDPHVAREIDRLLDNGFVAQAGERISVTDSGHLRLREAHQILLPKFKPALQDLPSETLSAAMITLREIRRTLDNLPD